MIDVRRAQPDPSKFNPGAVLPYGLRLDDVRMAMQDAYDLLYDINRALVSRGLRRLEETVRPAIFSGIMSDSLAASLARHSRTLAANPPAPRHPLAGIAEIPSTY